MEDNPLEAPRGILSTADREFLLGQDESIESKSQRERNVRARIRERLTYAVLDFTILLHRMEDRDLETVFSLDREVEDQDLFYAGVRDAIGLVYLMTENNDHTYDFGSLLDDGIRQAKSREHQGMAPPVEVEFNVEELESRLLGLVFSKLEAGKYNELSKAEARFALGEILESDKVPDDVVRQEYEEWRNSLRKERRMQAEEGFEELGDDVGIETREERMERARERLFEDEDEDEDE